MWRPEPEDGRQLLSVARAAIARAVGARGPDAETLLSRALEREVLRRPGAVFVTLRMDGALRGCLGTLEATDPLAEAVALHAAAAALEDPRFPRLHPTELLAVPLSVSVLGPSGPLPSPEALVPGRHGVVLALGGARPSSAPRGRRAEMDRWTLLEHLAVKAGLPRNGWRDAALSAFETATFAEPLY
jgi:AmmeMemoRadiSam system protein A